MLARIVGHLRAQWMGALALFLVLAGGVAYAANTISSTDIINGQVKSVDIGTGQVQSIDVKADGLSGDDIDEAALGQVPSAALGGVGAGGTIQDQCAPASTTFVTCADVSLTVPDEPPARALVIGKVRAFIGGGDNDGAGICRIDTTTAGVVPDSTATVNLFEDNSSDVITVVGISTTLDPGSNSLSIVCNETAGNIDYDEATVKAVPLSDA